MSVVIFILVRASNLFCALADAAQYANANARAVVISDFLNIDVSLSLQNFLVSIDRQILTRKKRPHQNEQPSSFHRTSFIQIAFCRALGPSCGRLLPLGRTRKLVHRSGKDRASQELHWSG